MRDLIASFHERMGLNAYVAGDYPAAEARFRKLEAREGETIRVLRNLGVILLAKGDAEGAGAYLSREEELYGPSYQRHCALGDLAYAAGRREEALKRYKAALAEPEAASGTRFSPRGLLQSRVAICGDKAAFGRSREAQARFALAEAARDGGRPEEAVAAFEAAAELDPSHWPALNNAGTILLNALLRPERALSLFERALAMSGSPQCARNAELARQALVEAERKAERERRKAR
jgi:tetratricopeptide (TPR) repeat protein